MDQRIIAIIPARGGSKGLLRKNIVDLAGSPLIAWTIKASLESKYITKTLVSSEDKEILSVADEYGAEVLERPKSLAGDTSNSESVVIHAIEYLRSNNETFDMIVLLQPTSPLRTSKNIDEALEFKFKREASGVISIVETDNKVLKTFTSNRNGFIESIGNNRFPFMRRQELPKTYLSNGAIYIIDTNEFMNNGSFFTDKTVGYQMSVIQSLDIDTQSDLDRAAELIGMEGKSWS
ncbi:acylneuraminate cytidylyltransferase family protein [Pseudomonadales bacterium]|nr:acylneuraminate cytidylyltransferase family protein [Pseudomonadales bacterium]